VRTNLFIARSESVVRVPLTYLTEVVSAYPVKCGVTLKFRTSPTTVGTSTQQFAWREDADKGRC